MTSPNKKSEAKSLATALKTLWGASDWPFGAAVKQPYQTESLAGVLHRLEQLVAVRASGLLCGANGVGKSRLVQTLMDQLPGKSYRPLLLTHSSLTGSDILRYLCQLQGIDPGMRRSGNVLSLRQYWSDLDGLWPVLIFEEAQNLSPTALEEIRLLSCDRPDTQTPFSLLLVGEPSLLTRLQLGVNRPLLSRLGFFLELSPWETSDCAAYLDFRLQQVGIHQNVFDPAAQQLLLQMAGGIPRIINSLAQRAFEEAARQNCRTIEREHLQLALDQLPWLGKIRDA